MRERCCACLKKVDLDLDFDGDHTRFKSAEKLTMRHIVD